MVLDWTPCYWIYEMIGVIHRLVFHTEVIKSPIPSSKISAYNSTWEYMALDYRPQGLCTSVLDTNSKHDSLGYARHLQRPMRLQLGVHG